MSTKYPAQIDDTSSLPSIIDNTTPLSKYGQIFNQLRDAVICLQRELGSTPSGINGTVKNRFGYIENAITIGGGGGGSVINISGDVDGLSTSSIVTAIQGKPVSSQHPDSEDILSWNGSNWFPQPLPTLSKVLSKGNQTNGHNIIISIGDKITINSAPISSTDAVNKAYVDSLSFSGATAGGDLTGTFPNPSIGNNKITNAMIRQSGALSIIGRSVNSTGNVADISTTSSSDAVLRESGGVIGFGTIATGGIANNAITDVKLRQSSALSIIGRSLNSTGNVADITTTSSSDAVLRESGGVLGFGTIATGGITDNAITFAKMQNIVTDSLLGRDSAGTGNVENITLNATLEMSGGSVLRRAALTGDATASAGSNAITVVRIQGRDVSSTAPTDGYVLTWVQASNSWQPYLPTSGSPGGGAGGDLSGLYPNPTIGTNKITFAKMQTIATSTLLGRNTAGTGNVESIGLNTTLSMDGSGNLQRSALTGDITASAGSNATTIANTAVTFAKMQNIATNNLIGRYSSGTGSPQSIALGRSFNFSSNNELKFAVYHNLLDYDNTLGVGNTDITTALTNILAVIGSNPTYRTHIVQLPAGGWDVQNSFNWSNNTKNIKYIGHGFTPAGTHIFAKATGDGYYCVKATGLTEFQDILFDCYGYTTYGLYIDATNAVRLRNVRVHNAKYCNIFVCNLESNQWSNVGSYWDPAFRLPGRTSFFIDACNALTIFGIWGGQHDGYGVVLVGKGSSRPKVNVLGIPYGVTYDERDANDCQIVQGVIETTNSNVNPADGYAHILIEGSTGVLISGLHVEGGNPTGNTSHDGVHINGSFRCKIEKCRFVSGNDIAGKAYLRIVNGNQNIITNNVIVGPNNYPYAIVNGLSAKRNIIQFNVVESVTYIRTGGIRVNDGYGYGSNNYEMTGENYGFAVDGRPPKNNIIAHGGDRYWNSFNTNRRIDFYYPSSDGYYYPYPYQCTPVSITGRTTAITSTPLFGAEEVTGSNFAMDGLYQLNVEVICTAAAAAGTLDFTISYTDDLGATTQNFTGFSLSTTGRNRQTFLFSLKNSNVNYSTTLNGMSGTATYAIKINCTLLTAHKA